MSICENKPIFRQMNESSWGQRDLGCNHNMPKLRQNVTPVFHLATTAKVV